MENLKKILQILKNKYVLVTLIFIVWITFFDSFSFIRRYSLHKNLMQLNEDKKYYLDQIKADSIVIGQLRSGDENLEKFAREHYLMKKDSEDIFIVERFPAKPKK